MLDGWTLDVIGVRLELLVVVVLCLIFKDNRDNLFSGDSPPVVLPASCQDPARSSKDEAIAEAGSIPVETETQSVELNHAEASVHEKRAEKRRRQKEKRTKQNGKSDERDADVLSRTLNSGELESPEDPQIRDEAPGTQKKDATGLDLGDRSKSETLGLAFVKNDPSLSSCDASECSESLSLELDGCEGESAKPEPLEESAGPGGVLSDALDPRSSVTDSSGVETSSDADVERHTFSTNSSASSVKDHDVIDEAYVECDAQEGSLKSLQWDRNDAEFTVVAKKKRVRSMKLSEESESVSAQAFDLASCGYKSFQKDGFPLESDVSLVSSVEPMVVRSQHGFVESDSLLFLAQNQSLDVVVAQDSDSSVLMSAVAIDDNGSTYTDDTSSDMGLSQFDFDDDYSSYLSKNDSEWTVVKTVRRTKCATVSSEAATEDRKNISLETAKCCDKTAKGGRVQPGAMENSGPKSAVGGWSQNSQYVNNREMGLKNFRLKEQNLAHVGFSGTGAHHHHLALTDGRREDGNSNKAHRNLCRSSSENASAGFKGISRIPSVSIGAEKCDRSFDKNSPKNCTEFKHVSAKSANAYAEKSSFFRAKRGSPAVVEKFISMGKFDVEAAARYIEAGELVVFLLYLLFI